MDGFRKVIIITLLVLIIFLNIGPVFSEASNIETMASYQTAGTSFQILGPDRCKDRDEDGFEDAECGGTDCNDKNAQIFPGNNEKICNGLDDDCDSMTTDTPDIDGDSDGIYICLDCNDTEPDIYPNAPEICDGKDNQCPGNIGFGFVDENVTVIFFRDWDNDTFGNKSFFLDACSPPEGYVLNGTDCNDSDGNINPGMDEKQCDGSDNDCDISSPDAPDEDNDGFDLCGFSDNINPDSKEADCDDIRSDIHPGATETCDGLDNNCDNEVDEEGTCQIPSFTMVHPTTSNGSVVSQNWIFINVTSDKPLSKSWIEIVDSTPPGKNFTLEGSHTNWYGNFTEKPDDTYHYRIWGLDHSLNMGTSEWSAITLDTRPPELSFSHGTPSVNANLSTGNISIIVRNNEAHPDTLALSLNGEKEYYPYDEINGSYPRGNNCRKIQETNTGITLNLSCLPDGKYSFYIMANDTAGNHNLTETRTVRIDTDPPGLKCGEWYIQNASISPLTSPGIRDNLTVSAGEFREPVDYRLIVRNQTDIISIFSGENALSISHVWNGKDKSNNFAEDGFYALELYLEDPAGNNITRILGHVNVDSKIPEILGFGIYPHPMNLNSTEKSIISINFTEASTWNITLLDMNRSVVANPSTLDSSSQTFGFEGLELEMDRYGSVKVSRILNTTCNNDRDIISIHDCSFSSIPESCFFFLESGKNGTALEIGNYSVEIEITDFVGNRFNTSRVLQVVDFPIDRTPPRVTVFSPLNLTYNVSILDLDYVVNENISWMGYSFEGSKNLTLFSNFTLDGLTNGSRCLSIYANDTWGNFNSTRVCFTVSHVVMQSNNVTPGTNISFDFSSMDMNFSFYNVTGEGNLTISKMRDNPKGDAPGYTPAGIFYDARTDADFSGKVRLCVNADPPKRLFHWTNGIWQDITVSGATGGIICGEAESLSPFGLFQEVSAPTTGGSSGGGGGGGSGGASAFIGKIEKGETGTALFSELTSPYISAIEITAARDIYSIGLSITYPKTPPYGAERVKELIFNYIRVKKPEVLSDSDISRAVIKFKVDKNWINEYNIDVDSIRLTRLEIFHWRKLETEYSGEDEKFIFFNANTPGFSYFAIMGEPISVSENDIPETTSTDPLIEDFMPFHESEIKTGSTKDDLSGLEVTVGEVRDEDPSPGRSQIAIQIWVSLIIISIAAGTGLHRWWSRRIK